MNQDEQGSSRTWMVFLFAAIAAVAVFAVLIMASPAADAAPNDHGKWGDVNYEFDGATGKLSIYGEGRMCSSYIGIPWENYKKDILSIEIGNYVTYVGQKAFFECTNARTVTIGESVNYLDKISFSDLDNLECIYFNAANCSGVDGLFAPFAWGYEGGDGVCIHFGDKVDNISDILFEKVPFREITFGENAKTWSTFGGTFLGTSLEVPDHVENLCGFSGCPNLKEVYIGSGIRVIGGLSGCESLEKVIFRGNGPEIVEGTSFAGCTKLTEYRCEVGPENYNLRTKEIGMMAFAMSGLTVANLPDTLTKLGPGAYMQCPNLTTVYIGENLEEIPRWAFGDCPIENLGFLPGDKPIKIWKDLFGCLVDKEDTPIYDPEHDYSGVEVRGRYFEKVGDNLLKDYETHEWGGDEPVPPVKPVKPVKTETETELIMNVDRTYVIFSAANVSDIKAAGADGKTVKIQFTDGCIILSPESAANIAGGIQTAAIGPADTSGISADLMKRVGDRTVYEVCVGGNHGFGGKITVSMKYQLKDGEKADDLMVWCLNDNGSCEKFNCTYKDGMVTFETDHLSNYAVMNDKGDTVMYAAAGIIALMAIAILVLSRFRKA